MERSIELRACRYCNPLATVSRYSFEEGEKDDATKNPITKNRCCTPLILHPTYQPSIARREGKED